MKLQWNQMILSLLAVVSMLGSGSSLHAADSATQATVPVRMTVTASVANNKRMPAITAQDIQVKQGKQSLAVTALAPANGDLAGLELFILVDEKTDPRVGAQLDDLRAFIKDQPPTTLIGVGYMRNASVQVVQNLTADHVLAAQSLRLPLGSVGAYGSPYLSVTSLMNQWPESGNRREVLMVTDGIDRARHYGNWRHGYYSNPDVDTAAAVAQRTGTNIHSIYAPGSGLTSRFYRNALNGQMNLSRLSDKTGGQSFYLGTHSPVSFAPYLAELQSVLNNQYLLSFEVKPGKKAGLQYINLSTEVAGVNLSAHDAVWVPAGK